MQISAVVIGGKILRLYITNEAEGGGFVMTRKLAGNRKKISKENFDEKIDQTYFFQDR